MTVAPTPEAYAEHLARQESMAKLRIPMLTDDVYAPYRERARRCGTFAIACQMRRQGWPVHIAVSILARKT